MFSFDVLVKFFQSGESIAVSGAFLDRAAMWAINLVHGCEVCLTIFNRIERFLDRASMNIASVGLDNVHEMGMPSFDVIVKFVFPGKSEKTTGAARIRAFECTILRMGFQVALEISLSRKPFPVLAARDIAPMGLHMMLEMLVEVGLGLDCDPGFSRSAARPLA
jgi:hypothetical protein